MKIISKHKDYYDYLQGIYGMDNILTYDRRDDTLSKFDPLLSKDDEYSIFDFAIAGQIYRVYEYKCKFYNSEDDLMELYKILLKRDDGHNIISLSSWDKDDTAPKGIKNLFERYNIKSEVNKKLRKPVLMCTNEDAYYYNRWNRNARTYNIDEWTLPDLGSYGFGGIIPAKEIFIKISSFMGWLVDNPPIPDNMTNNEKINSHGFDMKKSFRHRKKD